MLIFLIAPIKMRRKKMSWIILLTLADGSSLLLLVGLQPIADLLLTYKWEGNGRVVMVCKANRISENNWMESCTCYPLAPRTYVYNPIPLHRHIHKIISAINNQVQFNHSPYNFYIFLHDKGRFWSMFCWL